MDAEQRRRTPRFAFDAPAEILLDDGKSGAKRNASVKEISLNGCHVESSEILPEGASIVLKIFGKTDFFETHAVILYANSNGAGIGFRDVRPHFVSVLRKWLLTAMLQKSAAARLELK